MIGTTTTTTLPTASTTVPVMHIVVLQTQQVSGPGSTPEFTVLQSPYEVDERLEAETAAACQSVMKVVAP